MADRLRFDGKVVLVTGAGNGLGREYALQFGERGAKVVVNDLGGDIKGGGKSARAADLVVEEIRSKGGEAVANYDSVEDGEKVVQTALDTYGRIDVVINNAGILRDRSFARTSDLDWDLVHRVHLRGAFMVTRAAWPHMKQNGYGRIIVTTSSAGLFGNFGQANYSAAKMGLVGLGQTLAKEGEKYKIKSNILAPLAGSRLTETVMPPDIVEKLKPDFVAPVVLWLCHERCEETGGIYECGGGYFSKVRWQKSTGAAVKVPKGVKVTPEQVRDKWEQICDFSNPSYPTSTTESSTQAYELIMADDDDEGIAPNNTSASSSTPDAAIGHQMPNSEYEYTDRDSILYAIGVGVHTRQDDFLKWLFELSDEFSVLPSYGTCIMFGAMQNVMSGDFPVSINPTMILHGEQYLKLYKPLPTNAKVTNRAHVADVLDKGRGAVFIINIETFDSDGEKLCMNQSHVYVQKMGGYGGKRNSDKAIEAQAPPNRPPDASIEEKTNVDQASLYRLSGDYNPLHIDPDFAAMGGFDRPILHGLCSFGISAKHVLKQYCNNDVSKFGAIKVRFSKPVFPGETLCTEMWKEGNRVFFRTKVVESGNICLNNCFVDLVGDASESKATPQADALMSEVIFAEMEKRIKEHPEVAKKVGAIFQWNILKNGKPGQSWVVDLKSSPGEVYKGEPKPGVKPGAILTLEDSDYVDMVTGKLDGQKAFFSGKLKVKGNVMLTQKLSALMKEDSKI